MPGSLIHGDTQPSISRRVLGYSEAGDVCKLDDEEPLNGITGSGGQYSTLYDFFYWDQALYGNELVSEDTMRQVFTRTRLKHGEEFDPVAISDDVTDIYLSQ